MKIIILNKYQFKVNRGAETYVFELASRLSQFFEVKIISRVSYLELVKTDFDIIIPTNGRLQVFLTRIISWIKGAKMIVSGQSGPGIDDRLNLYAFPDVFIGLTEFQSKWAKKINPFVNVETIPNGVDVNKFTFLKKNKTNTVLAVGAFTDAKRHDLTIKAVSKIPGIKLIIAGGGGDRKEELEKMAKKILKERIEIVSVPHANMPQIYKKAGVFVFPTVTWESFGIVLLEAMASGLPVVTTDDPIRREIVGEAGIYVNPTNIGKYTKAIKKALKMKNRERLRSQAEKFSWDNIAIKYLKLINNITRNEN